MQNLADKRINYGKSFLEKEHLKASPFDMLSVWLKEVCDVPDANAMVLATSSGQQPSARVVLLKDLSEDGLTWFTHYDSQKGLELAQNPFAALVFFWPTVERQVRVEGKVELLSSEVSDAYFMSRPLASRIGAWASRVQSQVIDSRDLLDQEAEKIKKMYGEDVPRPPRWGGYRLVPSYFEFWQGRADRLHDRWRYRKDDDGLWVIERLSP
jgi:pyridoxamine 5'-phosphate oxidase